MLPQFHGANGCGGMSMIRGTDGHRINAVGHFIEHFSEVEILLCLRKTKGGFFENFLIDVADGDNVSMATRIVAIAGSLAFDPNAGEANCRVRGLFLCPA